jgi:chromosome partitioning protein
MPLSELHQFFEKLLHSNQLPSFLCGVFLGCSFVPLVLKATERWGAKWLIRELRTQISSVTIANRDLESSKEQLQDEVRKGDRERAWLQEKTKLQEGQILTLQEKATELSEECVIHATRVVDVGAKIKQERNARRLLARQVEAYSRQLDAVDNSDGKVWERPACGTVVPFVPLSQRRAAIISLVNLKGGVGKTTLTANIGAAFAAEGLRVLLIDLDHQSSLTNRCLAHRDRQDVKASHRYIDGFFEEGGDFAKFRRSVTRRQEFPGSGEIHVASVHEDFIDIENRLQARWLVGLLPEDVRFRLRGGLHSPRLRDHYDVVLIDCPPRWSTGSVNAIVASDYVLVPVLLDHTSAEAVPRLLGWLRKFQMNCCPELDLLGVVGNNATNRMNLVAQEQVVWTDVQARATDAQLRGTDAWKGPIRFFEEVIRKHPNVPGKFAALDPAHRFRYEKLIRLIREEISHAHLQPSAIHPTPGAASCGLRD